MAEQEQLVQGLRKLPSGKYQIRYTDPEGLRRSGGTHRHKRDALRALGRIEDSIRAGTWKPLAEAQEGGPDPRRVTLKEYSELWLATRLTKQGGSLAPKTQELYRYLMTGPLAEFADVSIRRITRAKVEEWWTRAEFGTGRTRNGAYKFLKALLDNAAERGLISVSPCKIENATSYKSKDTIAPTDTELGLIMESARADDLRAVIALMAFCGLRPAEALAIRRKSLLTTEVNDKTWWEVRVDSSLSWLKGGKIIFKEPKSESGKRTLPIPGPALPHLLKHLEAVPHDPEALLFSRDSEHKIPWPEFRLRQRLEPLRQLAGYKGSARGFRHYHLTRYGILGATIKEIMEQGGHSSVEAAMRYQLTTGRKYELAERLG